MKNYELIVELSKYPAGQEVIFDSIVNTDNHITGIDTDLTRVTKKIDGVDFEKDWIILC